MSVADWFRDFWKKHGNRSERPIWFQRIDGSLIDDAAWKARSDLEAVAGQHYYRLMAHRMNLRTAEFLGSDRHPVIHSQVTAEYAEATNVVFPSVAGNDKIGDLDLSGSGKFIGLDYHLTPLLPYHAGAVEVLAGVVSMKGPGLMDRLTNVVSEVTTLVPAAVSVGATVSTATNVVSTALKCIEVLFGHAEGDIVVATHAVFSDTAGTPLRGGLYAVVNPRHAVPDSGIDELTDPTKLAWQKNELCYLRNGTYERLRSFDWCVFAIAIDDHRAYTEFSELTLLVNKALTRLGESKIPEAQALLNAAIAAAWTSPAVVLADKRAIALEIREEFAKLAATLGITLPPVPALDLGASAEDSGPEPYFVSIAS